MFFLSGPLFAQEWMEFTSREDRFACLFPEQPKIAQTTYRSEYGADLPARVYSVTQGQSRYSVTVVDYNQVQRILTEKAKNCPAGDVVCRGVGGSGEGWWKVDLRAALVYASWKFMQRDAKVTQYQWNYGLWKRLAAPRFKVSESLPTISSPAIASKRGAFL